VPHLDFTAQRINDSASRVLPILREASAAMADDERRRPPAKQSFYWATMSGQQARNGDKLVSDYGFVRPCPVPSRVATTPKSKEFYMGTIPEKYRVRQHQAGMAKEVVVGDGYTPENDESELDMDESDV